MELIKGHYSGTNVQKITGSNPSLDIVHMHAYIQFGGMLSFFSPYIEQKRFWFVNQGSYLWYICAKNDVYNHKLDLVIISA